MKGGRSNREQPGTPRSPALTTKWLSADEQLRADLPLEPEFRRVSEWPTAPAPGKYKLSRIDQVSITIALMDSLDARARPPLSPDDQPPRTRLSLLCCGQAAPIAALMLLKGARRVEAVHFGFEPILVLCEFNSDPSALGMPSCPPMFTRQEITEALADPEALIDGLVWYDIEDERTFAYLERFKAIREAIHPGCSIIALKPCASAVTAQAELAALRSGSGGFLAAADELYRQARLAITERQDRTAETPLQELLKGGVAVVFNMDSHDM